MHRESWPGIRRGILLLGFSFLVGCGGCGKGEKKNPADDPNAMPFEGLTLDVAVPAGRNLKADWQSALSEWSFRSGAEHQLREYALPDAANANTAVLTPEGETPPEVMLIPWSAVPEFLAGEGLAEVPDAIRRDDQLDWRGYFTGLRNRAATLAGKPRVIPISCPVLVCYYRRDLLEKAGLSPPETWDDYQNLLDTLEEWAPGMSAVEPWGESFRASLFLARAASMAKHSEQFSFCFSLANGDPLIDNPGFVEALKQAKAALARMPAEVQTYSSEDCRREFLSGKAALAIAWESRLDQKTPRNESVQIGIARLPGSRRVYNTAINEWVDLDEESVHRVTFAGFTGWVLAVPADLDENTNNAAWELTRYMAIDQLPASYPAAMLSPCRDSETQDPTPWTGTQFTTSESEQYLAAVAQSLRSEQLSLELPLIGQAKFRAALTAGLTQAISENKDEQAALTKVAEDWRKISKELGKEKVAKSYQRSHE